MSMDVHSGTMAPRLSEDRLILDEFTHRTANEIAAAIAALRIARRMPADGASNALLDEAVGRMEAFGEVHRLLAKREHGLVDAGDRLRRLSCALASSRSHLAGVLTLDVADVPLEASTTRCLLMVASELITNALRHAFTSGGSRLLIRLLPYRTKVVMTISDDGPGMGSATGTSGTGLGRGIVRDLLERSGGRLEVRSGSPGTRIKVVLPIAPKVVGQRVRH